MSASPVSSGGTDIISQEASSQRPEAQIYLELPPVARDKATSRKLLLILSRCFASLNFCAIICKLKLVELC